MYAYSVGVRGSKCLYLLKKMVYFIGKQYYPDNYKILCHWINIMVWTVAPFTNMV